MIEDNDWDVRKIAFNKLHITEIIKLATETKDKAVKLASKVKMRNSMFWEETKSEIL